MTVEEVGRRVRLAFIQAAREAIALAEATNTLVIARGSEDSSEFVTGISVEAAKALLAEVSDFAPQDEGLIDGLEASE